MTDIQVWRHRGIVDAGTSATEQGGMSGRYEAGPNGVWVRAVSIAATTSRMSVFRVR